MSTEDLAVDQHISCMYAFARGFGVVNGLVRKVTPKTFVVDTKTRLITIKKANVMTLRLFNGESMTLFGRNSNEV